MGKVHTIWHNLHSHDFGIVFCFQMAFLVLAYIPTPNVKGFMLDLGKVMPKKMQPRLRSAAGQATAGLIDFPRLLVFSG